MALSLFRKAVNLSPNRLVIPKECGTAHKCPAIISLVCRENLSENFVCVQNVNYDDGEEETSIYFKTNEQVQIYTWTYIHMVSWPLLERGDTSTVSYIIYYTA